MCAASLLAGNPLRETILFFNEKFYGTVMTAEICAQFYVKFASFFSDKRNKRPYSLFKD